MYATSLAPTLLCGVWVSEIIRLIPVVTAVVDSFSTDHYVVLVEGEDLGGLC
jgi:hypothetical protein